MPKPPPQSPEPRWKGELRFWVPTVAGLIALAALGYAGIGWVADQVGLGSEKEPAPVRLEVHQAKPINRADVYEAGPAAPVQTRPSTPQIAVTVRNRGEEAALVERVEVTIEDSARPPICPVVGAAGPVEGHQHFYPIKLPWLPTRDELHIGHEMQQEVPAGKVGHFTFFFRVSSDFAAAHLYALRLGLIVDGAEHPIDLGRFVVGAPGPVPRTGFYLPESPQLLAGVYEPDSGYELSLSTTWCYRRNLAEMRRVLARPGRRFPTVAALAEVKVAGNWPRLADSRPARAAIEPLLATELLEGPVLAVFAAERTGDAELVESTRRRAAAQLTRWTRRGVTGSTVSDWTLAYARAAYRFAPSPEGRELIRVVEARQQGEEESLVNGGS